MPHEMRAKWLKLLTPILSNLNCKEKTYFKFSVFAKNCMYSVF